jgi:hypothetical protein
MGFLSTLVLTTLLVLLPKAEGRRRGLNRLLDRGDWSASWPGWVGGSARRHDPYGGDGPAQRRDPYGSSGGCLTRRRGMTPEAGAHSNGEPLWAHAEMIEVGGFGLWTLHELYIHVISLDADRPDIVTTGVTTVERLLASSHLPSALWIGLPGGMSANGLGDVRAMEEARLM